MRPTLFAALCLALVASLGAGAAVAAPSAKMAPIRVTFVGDSVAASISYAATAQAQLKKGLAVRLDPGAPPAAPAHEEVEEE